MTISVSALSELIEAIKSASLEHHVEVMSVLLCAVAELAAQLHRQGALDLGEYRAALQLHQSQIPEHMPRMRQAFAELQVFLSSAETSPPGPGSARQG